MNNAAGLKIRCALTVSSCLACAGCITPVWFDQGTVGVGLYGRKVQHHGPDSRYLRITGVGCVWSGGSLTMGYLDRQTLTLPQTEQGTVIDCPIGVIATGEVAERLARVEHISEMLGDFKLSKESQ